MNVTLYQAPYSSAIPVVWALAELSVPYENVKIDLASGAQKKPEFLALNPNGKVPTLVVDGTPMFEACAIVMWLGERFGVDKKLWPAADAPARMQAMAWSTWAYVTYGSMLARFATATGRAGKEYAQEKQVELTRNELGSLLTILDARLREAPYMLGAAFSLTDLIVAGAVWYGTQLGVGVERHEHVKAWLDRCLARPGFRAVGV